MNKSWFYLYHDWNTTSTYEHDRPASAVAEDRGIFTSAQYKTFQQHQVDLKKKKVNELNQMVRQNNVKGLSNVKKELLVESLRNANMPGSGRMQVCHACLTWLLNL